MSIYRDWKLMTRDLDVPATADAGSNVGAPIDVEKMSDLTVVLDPRDAGTKLQLQASQVAEGDADDDWVNVGDPIAATKGPIAVEGAWHRLRVVTLEHAAGEPRAKLSWRDVTLYRG
jgi:hypothetical protein